MADAPTGIGDQVKNSWTIVKKDLVPWVVATLIAGLLSIVGGNMLAGLTVMAQKSRNGEKVEIGDIFKGFDRFVDYFVIGLIAIIPLAGLLVPWAIFYSVEKKADFMTSIKWSLAYFLKNLVGCLIAFVVAWALCIVGCIACCVGIYVAQPVAINYLYDHYQATKGSTPDGATPEAPKV